MLGGQISASIQIDRKSIQVCYHDHPGSGFERSTQRVEVGTERFGTDIIQGDFRICADRRRGNIETAVRRKRHDFRVRVRKGTADGHPQGARAAVEQYQVVTAVLAEEQFAQVVERFTSSQCASETSPQ
jgi:hypothetical protein